MRKMGEMRKCKNAKIEKQLGHFRIFAHFARALIGCKAQKGNAAQVAQVAQAVAECGRCAPNAEVQIRRQVWVYRIRYNTQNSST